MALALGFVSPIFVKLPFDSPVITVMRGVLLALFIPALLVFFRGIGTLARRLRASDLFMVLTCLWIMLALTIVEGIGTAVISGSLLSLEAFGGYLIMRAYFTTRQDVEIFVKWFGRAVLALIGIAVIDHLAGSNAVANTFAMLVGKTHGSEYRNGILRATSTLEHPILYGTMCSLACIILYYGTRRSTYRLGYIGICSFGCLLAMSSAPLLALILGIGIIIYDAVLRSYPWRWKLLISGISFCVITLFLLRSDPIETLIRHLTIDTQTGFYRLMIWNYAGAEAMNSPWFGIGKGEWRRVPGMSGSVDTIWLVLALAYGLAVPILFCLALLTSFKRSGPAIPERYLDPFLTRMRRGLTITISLVIFIGFTVHFWGVMWTLLGILAGLRTTLEEMRAREVQGILRSRRRAPVRAPPRVLRPV